MPGLTTPAALFARIAAVKAASGYDGGMLPPHPRPALIAGLDADGAGLMLACARACLAPGYHAARGSSVESLAWWLKASHAERARARHLIRNAGRKLARCEAALRCLGLPDEPPRAA